ncbi:craniofacial development protein 2-like [Temnothorax curvispinosus]|uniref:Craniofacial development protein 2-like n=1 Tax=Temnothorax curvispinosus TaxID=300111 RepID=A0A6J1R9K1_9HYME|nr:craniofacial development protein 2-like [Temnothorax curvispinosus]
MSGNPADSRRLDGSGPSGMKLATGHRRVTHQASCENWVTGGKQPKVRQNQHIKIGTWNVRGLLQLGKRETVESEMQRCGVDILGLSETHLKDNGHFKTGNGNMIFLAGNGERSNNGVGFIVAKNLRDCVLGYEAIDDRIIKIRIGARPHTLNIVQVYAPTTECTEEEISDFYAKLETACRVKPRKETTVLLGDFNAKVGETTHDTHLNQTVGKHGLGVRNERGEMLLQFCIGNQFTIMNTWFKQHPRRLYTWMSPGGAYRNQNDYVLIDTRRRSSITNAKTLPGTNCGSDHQLLVAEFKSRLKIVHKASK